MKSNPSVKWVSAIVLLILVALVGYFFFRPSAQPALPLPTVTLPVNGQMVPLPSGADKERAKLQLEQAIADSEIDLAKYRTDAVAIHPGGSAEEAQFSAAPINQSFKEFPWDKPVMVWYDRQNSYGNGPIAYEVSFSNQVESIVATLVNPKIQRPVIIPATIAQQGTFLDQTWAFFVEGSCYGCGCCDGVCGCLVCLP